MMGGGGQGSRARSPGMADGEGSLQPGKDAGMSGVYPLYIIAFIVQLGMGIVGPILPDIMQEFTLAAWQAGMVVTMFGLARLAADLPLGLILDRVNRTFVLVAGTLFIVAGSVACGLSQDYSFLLAARFVMGMGSAMCTVTALFSLSKAAGAGARGKAIGTYQAAMIGGSTFGPALGGMVAAVAGWRASFFFCSLTGFLALSMVLLASRLGMLRLARGETKEPKQSATVGEAASRSIPWNLIAIDFTTFVIFFNVQGFRNSMAPVFGGTALGIGAGALGVLLGMSAFIRFFVTLVSGYMSDRYGRKAVVVPGTLIMAIGSAGFAMVGNLPGFVIFLAIHSMGGFGNSVPTTMVVDAVPPRQVGMAISVNRFVGDLGVLVGPVALGWLLDATNFQVVSLAAGLLMAATVPGILLTVREGPRGSLNRQWSGASAGH